MCSITSGKIPSPLSLTQKSTPPPTVLKADSFTGSSPASIVSLMHYTIMKKQYMLKLFSDTTEFVFSIN